MQGLKDHPNSAARDHRLEAQVRHRGDGQQHAGVELGNIRQLPGARVQVVDGRDAIDEYQVGTGSVVGTAAADGVVPAIDSEGIGASDDDKVRVAPGGEGGPDFLHVLVQGDDQLARKKAALFGK